MKTNRSLFKYIIFNILTCGIYSCFFISNMADDLNEICEDDGDRTRGFLGYLIFSILTCGIYSFVWWYKVADRQARNARKFNCDFTENGATWLLWMIFGSLICGIGSLVATHIVIRNMNELADGYNNRPMKKASGFWSKLFNN